MKEEEERQLQCFGSFHSSGVRNWLGTTSFNACVCVSEGERARLCCASGRLKGKTLDACWERAGRPHSDLVPSLISLPRGRTRRLLISFFPSSFLPCLQAEAARGSRAKSFLLFFLTPFFLRALPFTRFLGHCHEHRTQPLLPPAYLPLPTPPGNTLAHASHLCSLRRRFHLRLSLQSISVDRWKKILLDQT